MAVLHVSCVLVHLSAHGGQAIGRGGLAFSGGKKKRKSNLQISNLVFNLGLSQKAFYFPQKNVRSFTMEAENQKLTCHLLSVAKKYHSSWRIPAARGEETDSSSTDRNEHMQLFAHSVFFLLSLTVFKVIQLIVVCFFFPFPLQTT